MMDNGVVSMLAQSREKEENGKGTQFLRRKYDKV
jgi:hypothetical protein